MTSGHSMVSMKILVALAVVAASLALPAAPAHAVDAPDRVTGESGFDTVSSKSAEAECPPGQVVFGMGGKINYGGGRVALTAIMPGPMLGSVIVWGHALPDTTEPWSVTAVAVCHAPGVRAPERLTGARGQYGAQAECPGQKVLYSGGFRIIDPDGDEFIRAAFPSDDLKVMTVVAGGPSVDPESLEVQGICALPLPNSQRTEALPTPLDASSPKEAVAGLPANVNPAEEGWIFGAGARIVGSPGVLIDALLPTPTLKGAYGRAQKVDATTGPAIATEDGDDWQLLVDGEYHGEWC